MKALLHRGLDRSRELPQALRHLPWVSLGVVAAGIALAVAARWSLVDFKSADFYASLKPWYNTIRDQGFAAFGTDFSTYNPPYLYLLYVIARFFPDISVVLAVKLPGLISDFVCAVFVYRTVRLRPGPSRTPAFAAAMLVLFAPSVLLNAAFWGQADSVFTAGMLACIYFLMTRRSWLAMIGFGIALAFKLQTVFLAPIILALCLRRVVSLKSLIAVPVILFAAVLPSWLAGRPLADLLGIYLYQASQFEFISMNAASAYTWLPGTKQVFNLFYVPGVLMGAAAGYALFVITYKNRKDFSKSLILELSLAATLVIPFFLPKMHERYFFPADLLSIPFAFYCPELFFIPILIGGASFLSYSPFLFQTDVVPLPLLSGVMLIAVCVIGYHLARELFYGRPSERTEEPQAEPAATVDVAPVAGGGAP